MNNTINNSKQNVNFGAKLNFQTIARDPERLQNIARLFEQKTSRFPNDTLTLSHTYEDLGGFMDHFELHSPMQNGQNNFYVQSFQKILNASSDNDVAKKLVRLFKCMSKRAQRDQSLKDISAQRKNLLERIEFNRKRIKLLKEKGDNESANIYQRLTIQLDKKITGLDNLLTEVKAKYADVMKKIAGDDPDLEYFAQ